MKDDREPLELTSEFGSISTLNEELTKQNALRETDEEEENSKTKCTRICLALFVGQVLALLLGGSGIFAALLAGIGFSLPLCQNLPHYLLLTIIFTTIRLCVKFHPRGLDVTESPKEVPAWLHRWRGGLYILAGLIDMHAFWATLAAYAYTNVTTIQLLDCIGIPVTMLLSYFFLRHRYRWTHYVGACICIVGAIMMVGADVLAAHGSSGVHYKGGVKTIKHDQRSVIIGDVLAIVGAILYGMSCVLQEYITSNYGTIRYLSWSFMTAAISSGIYCLIVEFNPLNELVTIGSIDGQDIPTIAIVYFLCYVICMFSLDAIIAYTIVRISAVYINLSLLTADVYGLIAGIFLFHVPFHFLYFIAFGIIIVGVLLFSVRNAKKTLTLHN